jgi:hypothetical protein
VYGGTGARGVRSVVICVNKCGTSPAAACGQHSNNIKRGTIMASSLLLVAANNLLIFSGLCMLVGSVITESDVTARMKTIQHPAKKLGVMGSVYGMRGLRMIMKQLESKLAAVEAAIVPPRVAAPPAPPTAAAESSSTAPSGPLASEWATTAATTRAPRRRIIGPDDEDHLPPLVAVNSAVPAAIPATPATPANPATPTSPLQAEGTLLPPLPLTARDVVLLDHIVEGATSCSEDEGGDVSNDDDDAAATFSSAARVSPAGSVGEVEHDEDEKEGDEDDEDKNTHESHADAVEGEAKPAEAA